ncbi:MAG: inositol monophosphatase [Planctomycetaceae bacterium]|jgi:myo-inositol-1(or 4)-monophosphatase|nr:inositol monophosphatase [Planctomycetaceae bacterium]MBT6483830.1 inositol monophosphatase [Planctomycetaceae bacterium]MBT6496710.1 inositol monophosphatase [Planctomycetaceae bacterium]
MSVSETDFLETAEEAARLGGRILDEWSSKFTVSEKGRSDYVTEADLASQEAIYNLIHGRFPEHNFLGEEGLSETNSDSPYRWVIDPLDGTSNYVHRFPFYAVSIGLECDGELIAGVVFDPNRDEMFSALRGNGATLNGQPIQPTSVDSLDQAMAVASLPVVADRDHPAIERFLRALAVAQTVQRTGSAALNLVYVAAGRMDIYFSTTLKPWDMAGGAAIIQEAGGRVTKTDGSDLDIGEPDILASNGAAIHEQLQQLFA